jgi:hypothetical protein
MEKNFILWKFKPCNKNHNNCNKNHNMYELYFSIDDDLK